MGRLLRILLSKSTFVYNASKTRSLAMWVLSTQQLPSNILGMYKDDVAAILRQVINDPASEDNLVGDSLQVNLFSGYMRSKLTPLP